MPSGAINIDAHFPSFTGREDPREQTAVMLNYLRLLTENLKYTLKNIGVENFNEEELAQIKTDTTAALEQRCSALNRRVNELSEALSSMSGTLDALALLVSGTIQPGLETLQDAVQVDAGGSIVIGGADRSVELTGTVTANGREVQTV